MNTHLHAALTATGRGWHVFPIRRGSKKPALHGEDSCPGTGICRNGHQGWEQRAMRDPDRVRWYWTRQFADCNIGIACGPSNLLVIDLDTPKHPQVGDDGLYPKEGAQAFAALCRQAGQPVPKDTLTVATPSGGRHLYYHMPHGMRLGNTRGAHGGLAPLIDTRGWGGYVLAPGSTVPSGRYEITRDQQPAELPDWLAQSLQARTFNPSESTTGLHLNRLTATLPTSDRLPGYVAAALRGEAQRVTQAAETTHTSVLFTSAIALGQLVGAHLLPTGTAEHALYEAAGHMITGPCHCTEREVLRTIHNGLARGARNPRLLPASRYRGQTA